MDDHLTETLDPRIQIELESLNTATDEINKLEIELEEANTTFKMLLNESTRRLKMLSKKFGSAIEKSRPYHDAVEVMRKAQIECKAAAVKYQRTNEIHTAAKETVALAEQRFMSNSQGWKFDNAWQEMLNHATLKVMEAEKNKAESVAEHQRKAAALMATEKHVQELEERFRSSINKSRRYFEEKQICQEQLETQKRKIEQIQAQLANCKNTYATSLRNLEQISEEIHRQRGDLNEQTKIPSSPPSNCDVNEIICDSKPSPYLNKTSPSSLHLPDYTAELDRCEQQSVNSSTIASSAVSEKDSDEPQDDIDLEELRQKVKSLAVQPVENGDGHQMKMWENELQSTVDRLDHLMLIREMASKSNGSSAPATPNRPNGYDRTDHSFSDRASLSPSPSPTPSPRPLKQLQKLDPLPLANVSMMMLPTLSPAASAMEIMKASESNVMTATEVTAVPPLQPPKRKLSLQ